MVNLSAKRATHCARIPQHLRGRPVRIANHDGKDLEGASAGIAGKELTVTVPGHSVSTVAFGAPPPPTSEGQAQLRR